MLTILSYLSPHFYTYNVEIWLNRPDESRDDIKFRQNRSKQYTA